MLPPDWDPRRHYSRGSTGELPRTFLQRLLGNLRTARGALDCVPGSEHG